MKVKVGNQIFDSEIEPILIKLSDEEKELITNMGDQTKFCSFPYSSGIQDVANFIKEDFKNEC